MSNQIIKTTVTHPYFAVESHELDSLLLPNYIQNSQDAINYIRSNKKLQKTISMNGCYDTCTVYTTATDDIDDFDFNYNRGESIKIII